MDKEHTITLALPTLSLPSFCKLPFVRTSLLLIEVPGLLTSITVPNVSVVVDSGNYNGPPDLFHKQLHHFFSFNKIFNLLLLVLLN